MAEDPPLEAFVSGGYFLIRPFVPPPDRYAGSFPSDLVQPPVVTLSPCLADVLPSEWACSNWLSLSREDRESSAAEWGIPADRVADLVAWCFQQVEAGRILRDDAFADVETPRELARRFLPPGADVRLLGIGLRRDLEDGLQRAAEAESAALFGPGRSGAPNGVLEGARRLLPLAAGGKHLGYEVLDVAFGEPRHSWLCHSLERKMHDEMSVRLASGGLIPTYDQACRVAAYCDDTAAHGCERGVWRAWRVVEYALGT